MSNLSREDAGGGGGRGGHVVALKSNKKRMMDREQYLDATQRCVGSGTLPSIHVIY